VYYDNVSAIYLAGNSVQHQCTRHIEMDIYFVREKVARGQVQVLHVPSHYQIADTFTKGLPFVLFEDFWDNLSIRRPLALTAGCVSIYMIHICARLCISLSLNVYFR